MITCSIFREKSLAEVILIRFFTSTVEQFTRYLRGAVLWFLKQEKEEGKKLHTTLDVDLRSSFSVSSRALAGAEVTPYIRATLGTSLDVCYCDSNCEDPTNFFKVCEGLRPGLPPGPRRFFGKILLVFGCIGTDFCKKICV